MARIKVIKDYEIRKDMGKNILEDFLADEYETIDEDEEVCFKDLDSKNAVNFLYELKKQFNEEIDDYINRHFKENLLSLR